MVRVASGGTPVVWGDAHNDPLSEFAFPVTAVNKFSHLRSTGGGALRTRREKWPPNCTAAIGPAAPSAYDGHAVLSKRITNAKTTATRGVNSSPHTTTPPYLSIYPPLSLTSRCVEVLVDSVGLGTVVV